jgi:hypothetical protein
MLCTIENEIIYSITEIYNDNWNLLSPLNAGTLGLGKNSAAWSVIGNPATKKFEVNVGTM